MGTVNKTLFSRPAYLLVTLAIVLALSVIGDLSSESRVSAEVPLGATSIESSHASVSFTELPDGPVIVSQRVQDGEGQPSRPVASSTRLANLDIDLTSSNSAPRGIWTNGTTIWVVDEYDEKLYAYALNAKTRDSSKDLDLVDENGAPAGLYSDHFTIWVSDRNTNVIFAYEMEGGAPTGDAVPSKNLTLPDLEWGAGLMGDGTTLYAIAYVDEDILAYNIGTSGTFGERVTSKDLRHIFYYRQVRGLTINANGRDFYTVDGNAIYVRQKGAGRREQLLDFEVPSGVSPWGITVRGSDLWISDTSSDSLLAFSVPTAPTGTIRNVEPGENADGNGFLRVGINNPDSETVNLWARMRKLPSGSWENKSVSITGASNTFSFGKLDSDSTYEMQASTTSTFTSATTVSVTYTTPSKSTRVKRQIARDLVPAKREAAPWIWEVYRGMRRANMEVGYQDNAGFVTSTCFDRLVGRPLGWCESTRLYSDYEHAAVTVHEMAHVYTIGSGVPVRGAETSAMAWLHLVKVVEGGNNCPAEELLADSLTDHLFPGPRGYFRDCDVTGNRPSDETRAVIRSTARFQIPQWFNNRYGKSGLPYSTSSLDGYSTNYDLEKVADDVVGIPSFHRPAAIYQFRNSFGGYCNNGRAWSALTSSSSDVRNPWRAGGCVPKQVSSLSVTTDTEDNELDITWGKPAYDGGINLSNYTVRWRTFNEEFDASRRMVITDTDQRSAAIPLPAAKWEVQVEAVNPAGAGPAVTQGSANPPAITAISAANVSGSPGHVTVTVTTENFDSSIEIIYIRHRPTGGPDTWTATEHTAAATLTAALTDVRQNTVSTIQASLTPSFPSSATLSTTIMTVAGDNSQLKTLSVSPEDIYRFSSERHAYSVGLASSVTQATVNYSVFQPGSTVSASIADAVVGTDGHQVNISDGLNALVLTVTSANNATTTDYTVNIGRGVSTTFGWKAQDDLNRLDPDIPPYGISYLDSVQRISSPDDRELKACITLQCYPDLAIPLHTDNAAPKYQSDNGQFTVVVTDTEARRIYAYDIVNKERDTYFEFSLHADNDAPAGIWVGGSIAWVADSTDDKLYAYPLHDGEHQPDFDLKLAPDNDSPAGIWSDGATIWVVDNADAKIYAYDLFTSARKDLQDFNTLAAAGNTDPSGLASDGTTLWVTDTAGRKAYTYNMPQSQNANLNHIEGYGEAGFLLIIADFSPRVTHYTVAAPPVTDEITVSAEVQHGDASIEIIPADADDMAEGRQVALALGNNFVTFTVTAQDGTTKDYVLNVFKGSRPAAPANLTGTPRHAEVVLAWDKADANTVGKYQVRYKKTADTDWDPDWTDIPSSDGNTVSHTIDGLDNDDAYTFELRAKNPAGESTASSAGVTPMPKPSMPTGLAAHPGNQKAALNWNDPSDTTITHYEYRVSPDDGTTWDPDWTTISGSDASTTSYVVTSLMNDITHTIQVRAVNPYGESDAASESATPIPPPAAPVSFVASGGVGQAVLTWTDPSDSTITHYEYRVSADDGATWDPDWSTIPGSDASTTTHTLTPLPNDVAHLFEVRSVNISGDGFSSQDTATPRLLPQAPANLHAQPSDEQVALTWDNLNNDSITKYQYRHRKTTETDWNPDWTDIQGSDADTVSHSIDDLDNREEYIFEIRAVNSSGGGAASRVTATPQALPPAPAGFAAQPDDARANLSWTDPDDSLIEKYQYRVSVDGGMNWDPVWTDISGSTASTISFTAPNLKNAIEHTFEVRAVNAAGEGAASRATAIPNLLPPPVGNFSAKGEDTFVTLSWDSPAVASAVTKYQIRYRATTSTEWAPDWTDIPGGANTITYTATDLTNGIEYTFEIRTVNSRGEGAVSRITAIPGPPEAPTGLTANIGDKQVLLNWNDPHDDTITKWQYRYREFDSSDWKTNWTEIPDSSALTTSFTVTDLQNGADYTFEVRAVNHVGEGAETSVSVISVGPPTIPRQPENIAFDIHDGGLTVFWTRPREDFRAPVTSYIVRYREMEAADWTNVSQSISANSISHKITGLTNRRHYEVQVAAVNRIGTSTWVTGSDTPQGSTEPPPPEGLPEINVGHLAAYWTDAFGSKTLHPDSINTNTIQNSCTDEESFRVFWTGPDDDDQSNKLAAEWDAHIKTWGGAGEVTYSFLYERDGTEYVGMYGTVDLHGDARLTIRVRGRFVSQGWGEWSPPVGLFCFTE